MFVWTTCASLSNAAPIASSVEIPDNTDNACCAVFAAAPAVSLAASALLAAKDAVERISVTFVSSLLYI